MIWQHLKLPTPTRRQRNIARYIQNGPRRRGVFAFRGVGKSWMTAAYVLWRLYRNAQERILVVSANEDRAIEFAKFTRRLIDEVEQLRALLPRQGTRDAVQAFDVGPADAAQAPSVRAVGITGQLTGGRATLIVADDIEVPKNSYTETMRERLGELVKEFDAVLVPGGEVLYLGTPQTEQTVYLKVRERGYEFKIWPARYPSPDMIIKYGSALAEDIVLDLAADLKLVGKSTDSERFTDIDLAEREASYGRSGFALQFMLDTSLSDADRYPLKLADLIVMSVPVKLAPVSVEYARDPRYAMVDVPNVGFAGDRLHRPMAVSEQRTDWQGTVMYVDPSGRGKDETAYVVLRQCNGLLYLVAEGGFKDGYGDATLLGLIEIAKKHSASMILVEPNMGDGMFVSLLKPVSARLYPCTIEDAERAAGQKERRIIDVLEPVMNQHRLIVDEDVLRADLKAAEEEPRFSLFYQITHITKDRGALRHDDRLDALAGAVAYFIEQLGRDTKRAEQDHLAALREIEYQKFLTCALGTAYEAPRFAERVSFGRR
jgi:hypothetical protein